MSLTYQDTPDKCYYDVTISNLNTVDVLPPILYFNETRNNPFVLDPESYYLSIVRFSLDTNTLPVITPSIQPAPNSDVNKTIYSITLSWTNPIAPFQEFTVQEFIEFIPQDTQASVPSPPSLNSNGLQNNSTGYYNIFNFQYFILLVNNTFISAYNALNALVVADGLVLPSTYAPVMAWDTQTSCASISAESPGYNDTNSSYISIFFNASMFNLFSSFPYFILGTNQTLGRNVRLSTSNFGGTNLIQFPPPTYGSVACQIIQEYSTISSWTPITSVVFTSNTLPIVPNQISAPLLFYNGSIFNTGGNNSNIAQVITDFVAESYKPQIIYTPSAQYRLVNLVGNTPLYNLDIGVFYKDRVGSLIPFRLPSGGTATIKILFTRKYTENGGR